MKYLFIFLFIVTVLPLIGQSTLQVNIKDCREKGQYEYLTEFKLYRNDTLINTIQTDHKNTLTLEKLNYGEYKIEYVTYFKKIENVSIQLREKKKYTIDLCLDYFDYQSDPYIPFIKRIENNECFTIQMNSQGCFHQTNESLIISRKADKYYLKYNGNQKEMTNDEVILINHFEKELNYMQSFGCTTVDKYILKYNENEVLIIDGSCSWNGFYYLKKKLKLKEDE